MSFTSTLSEPNGYHPKITTTVTSAPPYQKCTLHLTFMLPPTVFIDKYDFPFEHLYEGHDDLELPVHALSNQSDSWLLVNPGENDQVEITIPLHLRYAKPRSGGGYTDVVMDWPNVFWACPQMQGSPSNPILGPFNPYFTNSSIQILSPTLMSPHNNTTFNFMIPTGNSDHLPYIEIANVTAVFISFIFLAITIWQTSKRLSTPDSLKLKHQ